MSKPTQELVHRGLLYGDIIDIGCGNGSDVEWLQRDYKLNVWGYDKYNEKFNNPHLLEQHYDCVICNYVFNVIPSLQEHEELLQTIKGLTDNAFVCIRSDKKAVKDSWIWSDKEQGYWTSKSFQRFYCEPMVDLLFGDVEYIVSNSSMKLFKLVNSNETMA